MDAEQLEHSYLYMLVGMQNGSDTFEDSLVGSYKLKYVPAL